MGEYSLGTTTHVQSLIGSCSKSGFHTEGGRLEFPPTPRNHEIDYGYYCGAINISFTCY